VIGSSIPLEAQAKTVMIGGLMKIARIARTAIAFLLRDFAVPLSFFLIFQLKGPKPAIATAVVIAAIQLGALLVLKRKISPFFLTASLFTILFGGMDFFVHEPHFFKLEPFAENAAIGLIFAATLAAGKPIVLWFAQALPEKFRPEITSASAAYLKKVTIAWILYFFAKGLFFLYLAFQVDLGQLVVWRSVIGGSTLLMMVGGEILYRRLRFPKRPT
jgi:uncharacterized membrane protein